MTAYLKTQVELGISATEQAIIAEHGQCSDWCCRRATSKTDNMANVREKAAAGDQSPGVTFHA